MGIMWSLIKKDQYYSKSVESHLFRPFLVVWKVSIYVFKLARLDAHYVNCFYVPRRSAKGGDWKYQPSIYPFVHVFSTITW